MSRLCLSKMVEADVEWFMACIKTHHYNKGQLVKYATRFDNLLGREIAKSLDDRRIIQLDGNRVGSVGIFERCDGVELSYFLVPEYEGKGIMTRVLSGLLEELGERNIECRVLKDNKRSLNLLRRLGFEIETEDSEMFRVVKKY